MMTKKISWFWMAFIIVFLFGGIFSVILQDGDIYADTILLLIIMGVGKFLSGN